MLLIKSNLRSKKNYYTLEVNAQNIYVSAHSWLKISLALFMLEVDSKID